MSLLGAAVALLFALVLGLSLVVLALARQIGILHERLAPVGALTLGGGVEVGDPAPPLTARLLDGLTLKLGGAADPGGMRLLLFVGADCPICKKIIPLAKSVAKAEHFALIFVGDDAPATQAGFVVQAGLSDYPFVNGPELGRAFGVGKLPYAVLLDEQGVVAAKGLVNNREHLESLGVAKSTGFDSLQSYLRARSEPKVLS